MAGGAEESRFVGGLPLFAPSSSSSSSSSPRPTPARMSLLRDLNKSLPVLPVMGGEEEEEEEEGAAFFALAPGLTGGLEPGEDDSPEEPARALEWVMQD